MRTRAALFLFAALPLFACSSNGAKKKTPATVTITLQGSGTVTSFPAGINCGTTCTGTFSVGDTIALVANAASGFALTKWTEPTCTGNLCQLTLTGNTTVTATFTSTVVQPMPAKVTVAVQGSGSVTSFPAGIDCGGMCTANFSIGQQIALMATPAPGFMLSGWSVQGCTGSVCALTLTSDVSVMVTFAAIPPMPAKVTVNVQGPGTVTSYPAGIDCGSTCSASFMIGDQVSLEAAPNPGSVFSGWSVSGCSGTLCGLSLTGDTTVTATFTTPTYAQLSVAVGGTGLGAVTSDDGAIHCPSEACVSQIPTGKMVTLTATPAMGYYFAGWFGGGLCNGTAPTCQVTASEAALQAKAMFTAVAYLSTDSLNGSAGTGGINVWLMGADGENRHPVSLYGKSGFESGNGDRVTLSADGTLAAVDSPAALDGSDTFSMTTNIWLLNMISGQASPITKYTVARATTPRITADGTKVYYVSNLDPSSMTEATTANTAIWVSNTDGSASAPVSPTPGQYRDVELSPDGTQLATLFTPSPGVQNLWIMSADGTAGRQLTALTTSASFSLPAWSPNGKSLVYLSNESVSDPTTTTNNAYNVWMVDVSTGTAKPLTSFAASSSTDLPVWSPDGKFVAFSMNVNADGSPASDGNVFMVDTTSGQITALTTMPGWDVGPMWAPDGSAVFYSNFPPGTSFANLWRADPSGATQPVQITQFTSGYSLTLGEPFD